MTPRSLLLIPLALAALSGCGLKGPLYLPGEKEQQTSVDTEQQRRERTRDSGAQPPAAPTDTSAPAPTAPPPEN